MRRGVRYLPLHSARHTAATSFINNGASPKAVQFLLGHSSIAYTLGSYVHVGEQEMKDLLGLEIKAQVALASD